MNKRELLALREKKLQDARKLVELSETENRDFTAEEQTSYDAIQSEIRSLDNRIERSGALEQQPAQRPTEAPAVIKTRGDSFEKMFKAYIRDNDISSEMRQFMGGDGVNFRASNNTDMNIGTPADGGYAVPTGLYERIIAKRNEAMLARRLGVLNVPGRGTTVNVAVDAGTANEFVATNEAAGYDNDAPALGQKALTLAKYTKKTVISEELLEDEDARVMDFVADYVGRALALTHNKLLWTEALAGGTSVSLTGGSGAFAVGHITQMVYGLKGEYG